MATVAAAIGLQLLLPSRLVAGPKLLLPALEVVLLASLVVVSPWRVTGPLRSRRRIAVAIAAVVSVANGFSLVLLAHQLLCTSLRTATS